MNHHTFRILFEKYVNNSCNQKEIQELFSYFESLSKEEQLLIKEEIGLYFDETDQFLSSANEETILNQTEKQLNALIEPPHFIISFFRSKLIWTIAAACLIFLTIGFLIQHKTLQRAPTNNMVKNAKKSIDIAPGKDQAILLLASGKSIELDAIETGQVLETEGVKLIKEKNGQLKYAFTATSHAPKMAHTIVTPKGGRYQLTLADGSQVWLNSASKLVFPAAFSTTSREVILTGEAYFEIAKDTKKPFFVHTKNQTIQVTGTRFNVSGYDDDGKTTTTLVEGQVIVNKSADSQHKIILSPGQEAIIKPEKETIKVGQANIEEALSWKNGWFVFEDMTLQEILKKVSRWYEITIPFDEIPHSRYSGAVPMDVNLSRLLDILERTGDVSFEINDKTLTVRKKPM